ncbi:MAG TPA: hypothetical protein VKA49_00390 [Flavitalea sp.]|nr:hypothetical protein [Flavitalea sp.]
MKVSQVAVICTALLFSSHSFSQIGKRFPSERKVVKDPVTGTKSQDPGNDHRRANA